MLRLQKILAAAGIASRRKAEQLISSGRVAVNGKTITELGTKNRPRRRHHHRRRKTARTSAALRLFFVEQNQRLRQRLSPTPKADPPSCNSSAIFPSASIPSAASTTLAKVCSCSRTMAPSPNNSPKPRPTSRKPIMSKSAASPTNKPFNASATASPSHSTTTAASKLRPQKSVYSKTPPIPGTKSLSSKAATAKSAAMFQSVGFLVEKIKRVQLGPPNPRCPPRQIPSPHRKGSSPTQIPVLVKHITQTK